jgi:hypothetical protein
MIPSDHFVRFYNEVFKSLDRKGRVHLVDYWHELGRLQVTELGDRFKTGGLEAAYEYWQRIFLEENCEGEVKLNGDVLELRMHKCPSLSKAMDNDAGAHGLYCDHCMAWVEPVMAHAGLHAVFDMESRIEPHCVMRVTRDKKKAEEFAKHAKLPSTPYIPASLPPR